MCLCGDLPPSFLPLCSYCTKYGVDIDPRLAQLCGIRPQMPWRRFVNADNQHLASPQVCVSGGRARGGAALMPVMRTGCVCGGGGMKAAAERLGSGIPFISAHPVEHSHQPRLLITAKSRGLPAACMLPCMRPVCVPVLQAFDLLSSLLRYDHNERATAAEALAHEYFAPVRCVYVCCTGQWRRGSGRC